MAVVVPPRGVIDACRWHSRGVLVVVGAVLVDRRAGEPRLLAAERAHPPALAGRWELPGGKVDADETEAAALVRECREELGIVVRVGPQVGPDLPIGDAAVLRAYEVYADGPGEPVPLEHRQLRWLAAAELGSVDWLPADRPLLHPLRELLARDRRGASSD